MTVYLFVLSECLLASTIVRIFSCHKHLAEVQVFKSLKSTGGSGFLIWTRIVDFSLTISCFSVNENAFKTSALLSLNDLKSSLITGRWALTKY